MSLILEALRKSEAERRRGTPPQLLDPPLMPSALPAIAAAPRRIPPAGMASIATAVVVLLGMTGHRMFVGSGDDEGAPAPAIATTGAAADIGSVASAPTMESMPSSAVAQLPASAAPRASGTMSPSPDASPAPTPTAIGTSDTANVKPASAAPAQPAVAARAAVAPTSIEPARPTTPNAPDPGPRTPDPRNRVPVSPQPATATLLSRGGSAPTTASMTRSTERADRARPASAAAPVPPTPIGPDRTADLARATPATPARGPDRSLPRAPAPTASTPPRSAPSAPPASPAADRRVRLADLTPADRSALPPLRMSMHLFAAAPADRFVILDGQRVGEGDRVGEAIVDEITADGAVLAWRGQRVWVSVR